MQCNYRIAQLVTIISQLFIGVLMYFIQWSNSLLSHSKNWDASAY